MVAGRMASVISEAAVQKAEPKIKEHLALAQRLAKDAAAGSSSKSK